MIKYRNKQPIGSKKTNVIYQLISDVDDTLHPAGWILGHGIAGVDSEGSRDIYYPCVKELHRQIYERFKLPTVLVSANPFPKSESSKKKIADELGIEFIEYNGGEMISSIWSTVLNILPIINTETAYYNIHYTSMANVKIQKITNHINDMKERYEDTNIEYRAIWIGDNGQGDLLAAKKLLNNGEIFAALIHNVDPIKHSGISSSWASGEEQHLFSFDNYRTVISQLKSLGLTFLKDCDEDV